MHKIALLASLLWTIVLAGGLAPAAHAADAPRWLVSPELLGAAKLEIVWETVLPIRPGEKLQTLSCVGGGVYALSDRNYLAALGGDKGNVVFAKSIAPVGFPLLGFDRFEDVLITVIGNSILEIKPGSGTIARTLPVTDYGLICPVARTESHYYLPGVDTRVHVVKAESLVELFTVAGTAQSAITSVVAADDYVVFATNAGYLMSFAPDRPYKFWDMQFAEGIVGPVVRSGDSLFFACGDTHVYRVDCPTITNKRLVWKHPIGSIPKTSPRVTANVVYQYGPLKGVTAIDRESGKALWKLPEGLDLLAESARRAYLISTQKTLVVMDNAGSRKVLTVNMADVDLYASNTQDARMYIGDTRGRVMCIRPAR